MTQTIDRGSPDFRISRHPRTKASPSKIKAPRNRAERRRAEKWANRKTVKS